MSLPDGTVTHWMAVMQYFFCVQFLSVRSSQDKQADLLYGALALCWLRYITHLAMFDKQMYLDIILFAKSTPPLTTEWPASDCHHWWYFYSASMRLMSFTLQLCNKLYNIRFSSLGYWAFLAGHLLLNVSENRGQGKHVFHFILENAENMKNYKLTVYLLFVKWNSLSPSSNKTDYRVQKLLRLQIEAVPILSEITIIVATDCLQIHVAW